MAYLFSAATVTNYHKLCGLKQQDQFSHSSGDQQSEIGVSLGLQFL